MTATLRNKRPFLPGALDPRTNCVLNANYSNL